MSDLKAMTDQQLEELRRDIADEQSDRRCPASAAGRCCSRPRGHDGQHHTLMDLWCSDLSRGMLLGGVQWSDPAP